MTEQDILLVAALAGLAVAITLGDLLFSLWRHRRKVALARAARSAIGRSPDEAVTVARREAIRRRLTAIQTAGEGDSSAPSSNGSNNDPSPIGREKG